MKRSLSAILLLVSTMVAHAASPVLSTITPYGGQRGTEVQATFSGARLGDAQEIMIYSPGITVKDLKIVNDNAVSVVFVIAPDCRLGEHVYRVRTATGISDARTFWVGALPVVDEKEPNNEFATPQPIALNTTVHGSIGNEDVDYFVVECKKGQRLSVEVEGNRLASGFWDPYVAILNDKRFELATSDDTPLVAQDPRCAIVVPADGSYIIMIRESAYGSGSRYRMHIGNFPSPTAVLPAGGKPGEEIEFRFLGDPAGEFKQKIKLPTNGDTFRLHPQTAEGIMPAGFPIRIVDLANVPESPANTTPQAAVASAVPAAFHGVVAAANETRYFKFAGKKGQVFDIRCYARALGSPLDPVLHIADANNNQLGTYRIGNDDSGGPDSYFRFSVPEDKDYFLYVHDHLRKGGPDYFFRIEVTPISARTTTNIPRVDGNNSSNQDRQNLTIPQGGRYATMVNVIRADWGGPLTLAIPALPPGVTVTVDPIESGMASVPVVFEAKPDAPLAGTLTPINATPTDVNVKAQSETKLPVYYNIALNNTPFHSVSVDRIAAAVTQAAPYSIEVIEPKAGIPQNGSMQMKVVAKRAEGFKGAITVYPLFTPPGIGIQGATTIPENATEALIPMNAAPNASVRKWKTSMIAVADAGKGPVWTSSQLFTLEVVAPYVTIVQDRTATEQGQPTQIFNKVTVNTPFEGEAVAQIIGLPPKVVAPELKITKDTKELTFPLTTDKTSPAGKHRVYLQVVVTVNGESLVHAVGGNELRIDVPLPPKVAVAPPMPMTPTPAPMPMPMTPATPPKRLTRLEQLRLEQEEREKAAKAATPAPMPPKKEEPKK